MPTCCCYSTVSVGIGLGPYVCYYTLTDGSYLEKHKKHWRLIDELRVTASVLKRLEHCWTINYYHKGSPVYVGRKRQNVLPPSAHTSTHGYVLHL